MTSYYYNDGKEQFGPFTLDELKTKGLTKETSVWSPEMDNWQKAGAVSALQGIFPKIPPIPTQAIPRTTPPRQQYSTDSSSNGNMETLLFISILAWAFISISNTLLQYFIPEWYNSPVKYYTIFTNLIYTIIPIIFALSIKNKSYQTIALVAAILIALQNVYGNLKWLLESF